MAFSALNPFNFEKPAAWGPGAAKHLEHIAQGQQHQATNGVSSSNRYAEGSNTELQHQGSEAAQTSSHDDIRKWLNAPAGERAALTL